MRAILTALLALHGVIHVFGLLKWAKLAQVPQLSGRTLVSMSASGERVFALFWAIALLVLVGAAVLRLLRHEAWWAPALAGIVLSQALIVVNWYDARFGTILNVLLLLPVLAAAAHAQFSRNIDQEIRVVLANSSISARSQVVETSDLRQLPEPVRHWLVTSGVVGRKPIQTVRVRQRGDLRTAPDAPWMPATADQYFTVNPPAFVWRVDTNLLGFLPISGRDRLALGHGEMLIKAGALVNIVKAADEKIDHGSLLRFLGEMVWFPSAALEPYISWEPVDRVRARATLRQGELVASAVFEFNQEGRVLAIHASRYFGGGADAQLMPWVVSCTAWHEFQGIEVPVRGEVAWTTASGPFTYYRWEMLEVEFDRNQLFGKPKASETARTKPITSITSTTRETLP